LAKDLTQLRLDTRMLLDEATAADFTAAQVDSAINYAYHELVSAAVITFEDYYIKTTELDAVENQQEYDVATDSFPSDFYKMRRVEIDYNTSSDTSVPSRATPVTLDDVQRDLGNSSGGISGRVVPVYYLIGQGSNLKLGLIPVPDEDGTDAIKLWYVYTVDDLSETGDEVDIPYPDRYARLISYGAAADLLRKGQQEEQAAARYRLEFEDGLKKMQEELEDRRADQGRGVTDTVGADLMMGPYRSV